MILSLFTVRSPGHYHQIHRTYEDSDLKALILIGESWIDDDKKQYYVIREAVPMAKRAVHHRTARGKIIEPAPLHGAI